MRLIIGRQSLLIFLIEMEHCLEYMEFQVK